MLLQGDLLETEFLDVVVQEPQLLNDIVIDGVLDSLHGVVEKLSKLFLRLAFVVFDLLVHKNLEPLQFVVPLDSEGIGVLADQLHGRVYFLLQLLEQVFVLELYIAFNFYDCLLEVGSELLDHAFVVLFLNNEVLFEVVVDKL